MNAIWQICIIFINFFCKNIALKIFANMFQKISFKIRNIGYDVNF